MQNHDNAFTGISKRDEIRTARIAHPTLKLVFLLVVCTTFGIIFVSSRLSYVSDDLKYAQDLLKRFQHFGNKIQGKLFVDEDAETFGTEVRETEDETIRRRRRTRHHDKRATTGLG